MSDLISRAAAIEALFDWEMTYDWDDHCREEDPKPAYIVSPSDVIEQLPSAQPERKVGKWIGSDDFDEYYRCSVCRKGGTQFGKLYRYCPWCGARMRGEEDDDRDTD